MDNSEHGVLTLCQDFGERAAPLPTASHKTDVVASVLPAPSVRGRVTYKQLAQATKMVLNKTMSGYPLAQQHCCTISIRKLRSPNFRGCARGVGVPVGLEAKGRVARYTGATDGIISISPHLLPALVVMAFLHKSTRTSTIEFA